MPLSYSVNEKKSDRGGWEGGGGGDSPPPPPPPAMQSHSKSNQLIATSYLTFPPSLMKFHQVILELSRKQKKIQPEGGGGGGGGGGFAPH